MVERWLKTPEVARWWGDPAEQLVLLKEDLDDPLMRQWIVEYGQRPFAYVQAYEAHAWPQVHLQSLPGGTQVIDAFIGEPDCLGMATEAHSWVCWPAASFEKVPL